MVNQELLSTDRTDLIDKFGVIQINLQIEVFEIRIYATFFIKMRDLIIVKIAEFSQIHYLEQANYPSKKFVTLNAMSALKTRKVSVKFC